MKYRLRTKLSLTYVLVVMITVGLFFILSRGFVDRHFIAYVERNNAARIDDVLYSIEHQYHETENWNVNKIQLIGSEALQDGLIITIKDRDKKEVLNMQKLFQKSDEELLSKIRGNMKKRYIDWNGKLITKTMTLQDRGEYVGEVTIRYYEPYYFTEHDYEFINLLSWIVRGVMLASIIFAVLIGLWISKQISRPISNTIFITKEISKGNFNNRIKVNTNTVEINEMADAVNILAEKLEEQESVRKRIVSDVSHELRTPLTAIQNNIEALMDGIWDPTYERFSYIYKEILRINRLVGDLSKLSRYENKLDRLSKSNFNLREVIMRLITGFEAEIREKAITIKNKIDVENMYADEDKISQLLVNILSNSIKYSIDSGEITITALDEDDDIIIVVEDEGIGIPKEDLPHIFERFYRVDKSRNKATGGSGIGLTIAKAIVEAHDGSIIITSNPGKGTEVTIRIPQNI